MILQTDVSLPRVILVGHVEFVRGAVGAFVRLGKFCEVDGVHLFAIQDDLDERAATGDFNVVPLTTGRFALRIGLERS